MFGIDLTYNIRKIFGIDLKSKESSSISNVIPPTKDASIDVVSTSMYGLGSVRSFNYDVMVKNESDLLQKYREMAAYPECDYAIDDIVNESIIVEDNRNIVELNLDLIDDISESTKKKIRDEFDYIYTNLLNFQDNAYEMFRNWYIDGKMYIQKIVDKNEKNGIVELKVIDPMFIRKIREVVIDRDGEESQYKFMVKNEYYIFDNRLPRDVFFGTDIPQNVAVLSKDSICSVSSGLYSSNRDMILSYIHKAIKPFNQLRLVEDALVIYRIARAPERRIFYVDVGSLPLAKAEQYLNDVMTKFQNRMVYDSSTGEVRNNTNFSTMLEDFFLPRREGNRGTEVSTLPGGCLAMDTKVQLLGGRNLSIREIENEMKQGITLWTYSCDPETGRIAPGIISWAGVTQKSADVMKLTLNNDKEIICTPDHKFPVWNKGKVEAKDLQLNDSIIPLYKDEDHKIVKIEHLPEKIEVGTLTIDNDEIYHDYHTFALECGVFTFNSNLSDIDDILYFQKKLYKSLNVPLSRMEPDASFNLGRVTEITRDELKFNKFIKRLRNKFSTLFCDLLRTQLILKNITTEDEFDEIKNSIVFSWSNDSYFTELKEMEIINDRISAMNNMDQYIGKYYSREWIRKNILQQSEDEIEEIDKQIEEEKKSEPNEPDEESNNVNKYRRF